MRKLTIALLLGSVSVAYGQTAQQEQARKHAVAECLSEAQAAYKREWLSNCPGGIQFNYPACQLPRHIARDLASDRATVEASCYQANSAGLFTPDEPVDMRPKTDGSVVVESEPRRKFWISPQ